MKRFVMTGLLALCALVLSACAELGAHLPVPGQSNYEQVIQRLGLPAKEWINADGSRQLAYPLGPRGVQTYMAEVDAKGILRKLAPALTADNFARIKRDMPAEQVERLLGPLTIPPSYFERRDELVWEWPYCDVWRYRARFTVLFDGHTKTVRSTMSLREQCGRDDCAC